MAKSNIQDVPQVFIKYPKLLEELRQEFEKFYDQDNKPIRVYDSQLQKFNERIHSPEIDIDPKLTPKELGIKFEEWFELLNNTQTTTTDIPQYEAQTTTTGLDLETKIEQAEKRNQQKTIIEAREKQAVEDYIKQNEERIAKAKSLQEKLKDKVVYAKVVIPEEEKLTQDEQKELEVLVTKAKNDAPVAGKVLTPKQELIDDFTLEIEKKLESVLKDLPEKEKEIIARTYAVEIVEKIANPEVVDERVQTVILDNIAKPKQEVVTKILQKDEELITLAKNGAVLIATKQNDDFSALEKITANLVGPKIASKILGKQNYQVTFSAVLVQGETTHTVQFGELNQQNIHELSQENIVLAKIQQHGQQFGYDKINSVFTTYLKGKVESLPAGSVIKKAYKDPIIQSIFARYGMAEPVVWQAAGQSRFVGLVMKIAPDTAGPILNMAGRISGSEFVTPIVSLSGGAIGAGLAAQTAATTASVTFTGGIMAGEAFAGGAGAAAAGAQTGAVLGGGTPLSIAFAAIGAAVGALFGKAISAAKVWWTKHKDDVKPVLAVLTTIGAIRFLGVGPGLGVGALATFGLMGTAGIATITTGAFGVLGFIGRSIGIAIATPVIITLLVIPPLVAFIMLVINNSAYIVPLGSNLSSIGADNPYMLVTKTAIPTKIENPTGSATVQVSYLVTIKALKENLVNVKIVSSKCNVVTKDRSIECPPEDIPELSTTLSISPTSPYTFTFYGEYDSKYSDSLIYDSVTVSAETSSGETITTSGSATVCIGNCPTDCVKTENFAQEWPSNLESNADTALGILSGEYQGFMSKVCSENEQIAICYNPSRIDEGYYAWHIHGGDGNKCDVYFNEKGLQSEDDALFLITHELSHHVQDIYGGWRGEYENSGAWNEISSTGFCTYSDTRGSETESMAEANGLYASIPSWGSCASNYSSQYPKNYIFAEKFMK